MGFGRLLGFLNFFWLIMFIIPFSLRNFSHEQICKCVNIQMPPHTTWHQKNQVNNSFSTVESLHVCVFVDSTYQKTCKKIFYVNKYIFHNLISFQTLDITAIFHQFYLMPSSKLSRPLKFSKLSFQLHLIYHLLFECCPEKHLANFWISVPSSSIPPNGFILNVSFRSKIKIQTLFLISSTTNISSSSSSSNVFISLCVLC